MINVLFYKYVELKKLEQLRKKLCSLCKENRLLGKILIAEEGINGCLSGEDDDVKSFVKAMKQAELFRDIDFKETKTVNHNFKKLFVRIRPEIVTANFERAKIKNKAPYVEPKELKKWIDDEEVILVDARNDYESKLGRFSNAITPEIKLFSEWPEAVKKLKNLKNKKLVTYCTGGVRCEKASAYMKEQGFKNVHQLHGGIIKYGIEVGNKHWQGKCFVFDTRGAIDIDPNSQSEPITQCELCNFPSGDYHNCAVVDCDKRFICCESCLEVLQGCCSKQCRNSNKKKVLVVESF